MMSETSEATHMRILILATGLSLAVIAVPVQKAFSEMSGSPKTEASVLEKAEERGLVRVIVSIDSTSEAAKSAGSQCSNDECAKLELASVLLPTEAPLIEILPGNQVLMEVTPAGLDVLQRLPQVVSIVEDGADAPHEGPVGVDLPTMH